MKQEELKSIIACIKKEIKWTVYIIFFLMGLPFLIVYLWIFVF